VKIPQAPFTKGGDIWGFGKGGDILAFAKGGDILRLFSDRMPARIVCRKRSHVGKFPKTAEHSPPLKKGGRGGFPMKKGGARGELLFSTSPGPLRHYPIHLLHHRFRFYHYLPAVKIPPAPFGKGGDILAFAKGGDIWGILWPDEIPPAPFGKGGDILRLFSDRMPARIVCRKRSHVGKFPKTAEHSPPLKKGGQGGFPMKKGRARGGLLFSTSPALSITTR
jgi:hypothetical protein